MDTRCSKAPTEGVSYCKAETVADGIGGVAINAIGQSQGGGFEPLQGCREPRRGQSSTRGVGEDFGLTQVCRMKSRRADEAERCAENIFFGGVPRRMTPDENASASREASDVRNSTRTDSDWSIHPIRGLNAEQLTRQQVASAALTWTP